MKKSSKILISVSLIAIVVAVVIVLIVVLGKKDDKDDKGGGGSGKGPSPGPSPPTPPSPTGDWVYRDINTQSDGVTHYWDCCKETCSWWDHAPDYGTNQCDKKGENPIPADNNTQFPKSVCDKDGTQATCQNRYPEIITNSDGSKTLMGFVASAKQLFVDFAPDSNNDYCGQCYELEFYPQTLNNNANIKNAIVQVTNTGDGHGIFDFEVPGGGFGANNGCHSYSDWKVYKDQGGPCGSTTECNDKDVDNIEGCAVYGGFQNQKYCNSAFRNDSKAQKACNDILWGIFKPRNQIPNEAHCPGYPENIKIKRYRPIKCPNWHTSKTGSSKAPLAKKAKKNDDKCNDDSECSSRNCHNNICTVGNKSNGQTCTYNKECQSKYCKDICMTRPQGNICYYNDICFKDVNKNIQVDKNKTNLLKNCPTPDDYCKNCTQKQIGIGDIFYEFDKGQNWADIFKTDDQFKTFFEVAGGVTCPYLPDKYKKTCARLEEQCGGKSWDGPTYCGKDENDKTNCECVKDNDYYSQCRLKK